MTNWFKTINGAVTLSLMALLSEAWRGFLDAMFVFPTDIADDKLMILGSLIFTLLFSGWAWALAVAAKGSRGGLAAAFLLNGLVLLAIPVSWLFFYCPAECQADAGIFNLANTLNLLFGSLAAVSLGYQLKYGPRSGGDDGMAPTAAR